MVTPQHKNPYPGGHEIYKFGRPFLGHHYYLLSLYELFVWTMPRSREEDFLKKYINLTLLYLKITTLRGHKWSEDPWRCEDAVQHI